MRKKIAAFLSALLLLTQGCYGIAPYGAQSPPPALMESQTDGHTKEDTPEQKPEETPAQTQADLHIPKPDIKEFGDETNAVFEIVGYGQVHIKSMRVATPEETAQAKYTPEECLELYAKWEARRNGSTVTKIDMKHISREDGSLFTGPAYRVDSSKLYSWPYQYQTLVYVLNPYASAEMVNGKLLVRMRMTHYNVSIPNMDMLALFGGRYFFSNLNEFSNEEYFIDPDTLQLYMYSKNLQSLYISKLDLLEC